MGYRSDIYVAIKTDDYFLLKNHPAIAGAAEHWGSKEGTEYTLLTLNEVKWYGAWEDSDRHASEMKYVKDQEEFMDEIKKLDFFNFVRTGELMEDVEEHCSSDTGNRLVWVELVESQGSADRLPLVVYDEDVYPELNWFNGY